MRILIDFPFSRLILFRQSREIFPNVAIGRTIESIDRELGESKDELLVLTKMLDKQNVDRHYVNAIKGICGGGLFGLSLMTVASLVAAFFLTILVCVDSHTWIYLSARYAYLTEKWPVEMAINISRFSFGLLQASRR